MTKFNDRPLLSQKQRRAALDHDLKAARDGERLNGGLLPSTLGWGQRKSDKRRITLFDPWKGTVK
jgi:hypothetical protein